MTADQKKRLWLLSLFGGLCAGIVAFLAFAFWNANSIPPSDDSASTDIYTFGLYAVIGTFTAVQLMWRLMLRRKTETKSRGLKYGAFAGLLALFIVMTCVSYHYQYPFENPYGNTIFDTLILVPVVMSLFGFIFGGFLAPIFGAILGHKFTRNMDSIHRD